MPCPTKCLVIAGVGGIIPTVSRLASAYVSDPSTPMPQAGMAIGLLLFFIIGAILAYAFSENSIKQAFILGICAPGIITNIVAGVNDSSTSQQSTSALLDFHIISTAYADPQPTGNITPPPATSTSSPVLKINTSVTGGGKWERSKTKITVSFIKANGSSVTAASFSSAQSSISVSAPPGAVAVRIQAGSKALTRNLPTGSYTSAVIDTNISVKGTNDFMWALGAKREPSVEAIQVNIHNIQK